MLAPRVLNPKPAITIGDLRAILSQIPVSHDDHEVILNLPVFDPTDLVTPESFEEVPLTDYLRMEDDYELHLFGEVP